jgi:hypothetical protein
MSVPRMRLLYECERPEIQPCKRMQLILGRQCDNSLIISHLKKTSQGIGKFVFSLFGQRLTVCTLEQMFT